MPDVLKIALERRDQLNTEIERLDQFIRTAEMLIRGTQPRVAGGTEDADVPGPVRMNLMRRGAANVG